MPSKLELHDDRLFPAEPGIRQIARGLYGAVADLPIISPHGHTDPKWFAGNQPFSNPTELLIVPDHYLLRMLYSQGIPLDALGIGTPEDQRSADDARNIWRLFATHYHLFRGTPSRLWLDHVFGNVFELDVVLSETTADHYYDHIDDCLKRDDFWPRALFERFNIEVLATTESPTDPLASHDAIRTSGWTGRVITTFRPDPVVDPEFEGFRANLQQLSEITGENTATWSGYLQALANRRDFFREHGATSTDHGHPTAQTADLARNECQALLDKAMKGAITAGEAEQFRAQMLTEMAKMSCDDGLVMQLHPGSFRNHNRDVFEKFGRDKGADIPIRTEYVHALKPLLDKFGNQPGFTLILFTLDESTYSRELAPLAGHYPCLKLGPAWWFHDSPEGMRRFRELTTETAGFYNTVGFNDDTRAFMSIPARHDVARRMDAGFLARLVAEHRLPEAEALELIRLLTYDLVKSAYRL
jgi:glucuronate isomerase